MISCFSLETLPLMAFDPAGFFPPPGCKLDAGNFSFFSFFPWLCSLFYDRIVLVNSPVSVFNPPNLPFFFFPLPAWSFPDRLGFFYGDC